jgi:hypothetical protein
MMFILVVVNLQTRVMRKKKKVEVDQERASIIDTIIATFANNRSKRDPSPFRAWKKKGVQRIRKIRITTTIVKHQNPRHL